MPSTWIKMLKIWYASDKEIFRYSHLTSREKSLAVSSKMHLQALHHEGQDHLTLYRLGLSNPPSTTTKRTKGIKGPSFSCILGMLVQKLKLNNKLSNYWGSKCRIHSERPRWTLLLLSVPLASPWSTGPLAAPVLMQWILKNLTIRASGNGQSQAMHFAKLLLGS